ncbi:MAG: FAD-dependent oxidoreductase [Cyanobacteriota bacterium]|nr:FAD-dependent oxidoreductase [Cyanobacteriota bacterium]
MVPPAQGPSPITVIGDGLAGTLLALSLARRGAAVRLIGRGPDTATALSYGAIAPGAPSRAWRRLERLHGPLGWHSSGLVFHDARPGLPHLLAALSQRLPVPLAHIDTPTWMAACPQALAAAGVQHLARRVAALEAKPQGGWLLDLEPTDPAGSPSRAVEVLETTTVVLAAGAHCRTLWPDLPAQLRHSWAGVLLVGADAPANPWLDQARRGRIVQPRRWQRPALEAASATPSAEPRWIVDAGMAPWGEGLVVGQISWLPETTALGPSQLLQPPDPPWMEGRLREGLGQLDPQLATLSAPYRQVPVSFCTDGQPLATPVDGAPGLWAFAGFSAAFSIVPAMAERLAERLMAQGSHHGQ